MAEQTTTRPKTVHELLNLSPEERRQRAEALAAMFARWEEEGDPDEDSTISWDEMLRDMAEHPITFRIPVIDE